MRDIALTFTYCTLWVTVLQAAGNAGIEERKR
jgi:hypothetical protein